MTVIARYWKAVIAAVGLAATILTSLQPLWGDDLPDWVPVVIAALTAVGVYLKANTPPPADPPPADLGPLAEAGGGHVTVNPETIARTMKTRAPDDPGHADLSTVLIALAVSIIVLTVWVQLIR